MLSAAKQLAGGEGDLLAKPLPASTKSGVFVPPATWDALVVEQKLFNKKTFTIEFLL